MLVKMDLGCCAGVGCERALVQEPVPLFWLAQNVRREQCLKHWLVFSNFSEHPGYNELVMLILLQCLNYFAALKNE